MHARIKGVNILFQIRVIAFIEASHVRWLPHRFLAVKENACDAWCCSTSLLVCIVLGNDVDRMVLDAALQDPAHTEEGGGLSPSGRPYDSWGYTEEKYAVFLCR